MCFPNAFNKALQLRTVHDGSVTDSIINQSSRGARDFHVTREQDLTLNTGSQLDSNNSNGGAFQSPAMTKGMPAFVT